MKRASVIVQNPNFLLSAYVIFMLFSRMVLPFSWLACLTAWICLIAARTMSEHRISFIFKLWIATLVESAIAMAWLLTYRFDAYLWGWLILGALIPVLFAIIEALSGLLCYFCQNLSLRPLAYGVGIAIFYAILGFLPFGQAPLRSYFDLPVPVLLLLKPLGLLGGLGFLGASLAALVEARMQKPVHAKSRRILHYGLATIWIGLALWLMAHTWLIPKPQPANTLKVALIQHLMDKTKESKQTIEEDFYRLAEEASALQPKPDLIIFPLLTLPLDLSHQQVLPRFLKKLATRSGTYVLIATKTRFSTQHRKINPPFSPTNSAFLVSPEGQIINEYQAVETTPLHDIRIGLASAYQTINSPWGELGILLCYESTDLKWARIAKSQRAKVLIGLQNLLLFKNSSLPAQSLREDRIAAILTGLPFLRASTGGFSAAISDRGKILTKSRVGKEEILFAEIKI